MCWISWSAIALLPLPLNPKMLMRRVRPKIQFSKVVSSDVGSKNVEISGASSKSMWGCFAVGWGFWGEVGDRAFSPQTLRFLLTVTFSPVIFSTIDGEVLGEISITMIL
jgi:hypothetical protein